MLCRTGKSGLRAEVNQCNFTPEHAETAEIKYEIRNKHECLKFEYRKGCRLLFCSFGNLNLVFVLDFDIRASNFDTTSACFAVSAVKIFSEVNCNPAGAEVFFHLVNGVIFEMGNRGHKDGFGVAFDNYVVEVLELTSPA